MIAEFSGFSIPNEAMRQCYADHWIAFEDKVDSRIMVSWEAVLSLIHGSEPSTDPAERVMISLYLCPIQDVTKSEIKREIGHGAGVSTLCKGVLSAFNQALKMYLQTRGLENVVNSDGTPVRYFQRGKGWVSEFKYLH